MTNVKEEIGEFPPVMETQNLILRQFEESDFEEFKKLLQDPEIARWLAFLGGRVISDADAIDYFQNYVLAQKKLPKKDRTFFDFAITDNSRKYLGHTMLTYNTEYDPDGKHENLELSFYLTKSEHNKNIATEANTAMMEFGFNRLGLGAIHATHAPDNIPSQRVLQKLRFPYKGKKKVQMGRSGEVRESLYYAMTNQEWIQSKKENPLIQPTLSSLKINDTV